MADRVVQAQMAGLSHLSHLKMRCLAVTSRGRRYDINRRAVGGMARREIARIHLLRLLVALLILNRSFLCIGDFSLTGLCLLAFYLIEWLGIIRGQAYKLLIVHM